MTLKTELKNLIGHLKRTGTPRAITLQRGLRIAARMVYDEIDTGPPFIQLSLTRTKDTAPSHDEARIVMDALGWANAWTHEATNRAGLPCILINEGEPLFGAP